MSNEIKGAPSPKRWKLAKGKGLKINGVDIVITNDNVNDPNILRIIANAQKNGRTYFGKAIVEK